MLDIISTKALLRALRPRGAPTRTATRILGRLYAAPGHIVSMGELIQAAYADDPGGGAEGARVVVKQTLARLRGRGVPVETIGRRGYRVPERAP